MSALLLNTGSVCEAIRVTCFWYKLILLSYIELWRSQTTPAEWKAYKISVLLASPITPLISDYIFWCAHVRVNRFHLRHIIRVIMPAGSIFTSHSHAITSTDMASNLAVSITELKTEYDNVHNLGIVLKSGVYLINKLNTETRFFQHKDIALKSASYQYTFTCSSHLFQWF